MAFLIIMAIIGTIATVYALALLAIKCAAYIVVAKNSFKERVRVISGVDSEEIKARAAEKRAYLEKRRELANKARTQKEILMKEEKEMKLLIAKKKAENKKALKLAAVQVAAEETHVEEPEQTTIEPVVEQPIVEQPTIEQPVVETVVETIEE